MAARKTAVSKALEKKILRKIRADANITEKSHALQRMVNGKAPAKKGPMIEEIDGILLEFEEPSDEEADLFADAPSDVENDEDAEEGAPATAV